MRHHDQTRERGWSRSGSDHRHGDVDHHDFHHDIGWDSYRVGEDRIERLEALQRDLEEMTADVATRVDDLKRR